MAEAGTVLIAVRDSVLADSLRFSLELEGYEAKLCERPLDPPADGALRTCLLLDQEVFTTLWGRGGTGALTRFGLPTVRDILTELEKPGRDPRPEFKTAFFF